MLCVQGDMEQSLGWQPIPLCDKRHKAQLPAMQVPDIIYRTGHI